MKNEINAVLENMTTTIPEPEDYTGEDGLLYCGKCRKPKEAYFAPDKAAIFGRDRPRGTGSRRKAAQTP
jgi:DNA replication protein DnaC